MFHSLPYSPLPCSAAKASHSTYVKNPQLLPKQVGICSNQSMNTSPLQFASSGCHQPEHSPPTIWYDQRCRNLAGSTSECELCHCSPTLWLEVAVALSTHRLKARIHLEMLMSLYCCNCFHTGQLPWNSAAWWLESHCQQIPECQHPDSSEAMDTMDSCFILAIAQSCVIAYV